MKLTPLRPLGRPNRKALAFEAEIARLRSEGYSCEAIWEALLAAGVALSRSSVKREVARLAKKSVAAPASAPVASTRHGPSPTFPPAAPSPATPRSSLSSKEIAEAWMRDHITNPLVRARIAHESSRR